MTSRTSNIEIRLHCSEDGRFFVPIGRADTDQEAESLVAKLTEMFPRHGVGFAAVETDVFRPADEFQWPDEWTVGVVVTA